MRIFVILFISLGFMISCNSVNKEYAAEIETLEKNVEANPTPENTLALVQKYEDYAKNHSSDKEWSGRYLYRAATIYYRSRNYAKALETINKVLTNFKSSEGAPNALLLKGNIYDEKLFNEEEAGKAYQQFLDDYPNHEGKTTAEFFFKPLKEKLTIQIADLEGELYQENARTRINPSVSSQLRRKYSDYAEKVTDDPEGGVGYLVKSAKLMGEMSNFTGALQTLDRAADKYPEANGMADVLLAKAEIFEDDLGDEPKAREAANSFIEKFPNHPKVEEARFFLKPANEKLAIKIADLEAKVYQDSLGTRLDPRLAQQLINKYVQAADLKPKSPETASNLYKAGEIARSIRNFPKALELWARVYEDYPSYEKAPQSLFLQGYIHENDFKNLERAEEIYNKFLKQYPSHDLADDVQFSLKFLGKPADEIIKSFEGKKEGE
ncbi:MAG: tetratricopeptide repeat protein [Bacteroidota bacterium]